MFCVYLIQMLHVGVRWQRREWRYHMCSHILHLLNVDFTWLCYRMSRVLINSEFWSSTVSACGLLHLLFYCCNKHSAKCTSKLKEMLWSSFPVFSNVHIKLSSSPLSNASFWPSPFLIFFLSKASTSKGTLEIDPDDPVTTIESESNSLQFYIIKKISMFLCLSISIGNCLV